MSAAQIINSAQSPIDVVPIGGRIGLRLVDIGNVVHANDERGLLVITQVQPISVLFTVPEDDLRAVLEKSASGSAAGGTQHPKLGVFRYRISRPAARRERDQGHAGHLLVYAYRSHRRCCEW